MADTLVPQAASPLVAAPLSGTAMASSAGHGIASAVFKNRALVLALASMLVLLGFISLVWWSSKPEYKMLYGNMDEKQASEVVKSLQKNHIPYQLSGGNTILVPADKLYSARLQLASNGVTPSTGSGFELFDRADSFGLSNFAQKVNYQRALQGELARTIEVMPEVIAARIHLVLPKESAFIEHQRKASASVMLQLAGGHGLRQEAVRAIQNLVSSSVPELTIANVSVVDSSGNMLSADKEASGMGGGNTMQDMQTGMEHRLEARLTGMLEQMVGVGQAVVRVTAELNREQVDQQKESFNPDEVAIRSQKENSESRSDGSTLLAEGAPGLAANSPIDKSQNPAAKKTGGEQASHTERVTNYEISSMKEHRIIPSGSVKRMSVAVIVGGHTKKAEDGKETFVPRSKQELKSIGLLVRNAFGYDEGRGDSVEVQSMPLVSISNSSELNAATSAERKSFYMRIAGYVLAGLAIIMIGMFVLRPMAAYMTAQREATMAIALQDLGGGQAAMAGITGEAMAGVLADQSMQKVDIHAGTKELIAGNPEQVARVLQQWTRQ